MYQRGFTLIEMIVVSVVVGFIIFSFTAMSLFFVRQVNISRERTNMYSQLDYTLSDMRLRCISAVATSTPLAPGGNTIINDTIGTFSFEGESNIYDITPDNTSPASNVIYTYDVFPVTDLDNPGSLVLHTTNKVTGVTIATDVLIDGKYHPSVVFAHDCLSAAACDEPDFITVTVSLLEPIENISVNRSEGIRFWFLSVVQ